MVGDKDKIVDAGNQADTDESLGKAKEHEGLSDSDAVEEHFKQNIMLDVGGVQDTENAAEGETQENNIEDPSQHEPEQASKSTQDNAIQEERGEVGVSTQDSENLGLRSEGVGGGAVRNHAIRDAHDEAVVSAQDGGQSAAQLVEGIADADLTKSSSTVDAENTLNESAFDHISVDQEIEEGVKFSVGGASQDKENNNAAPTGLAVSNLSVDENTDGAVIGNISSSDADAGDVHTYTVDDARFEIVEDNNGNAQLKLKDGQSLDYESADTVSVEVTAIDSTGLSSSKVFDINIQDINEAPVAVNDVIQNASYESAELIGYYRFDDGLGIDSAGNNNAELVNEVTQSDVGVIGGSANYSHSDSARQIKINDLPIADADDVTVSFWMNWDGINNVMPIGFGLYDLYINGNKIGFNTGVGDQYGIDGSDDLANSWHHITATFHKGDATQSKLFIDGEAQELSAVGSNTPNNTAAHFNRSELHLGGWGGGESYRFGGQLDEVRVFNGVLTDDEVRSIYTIESSGFSDVMSLEDAAYIIRADTLLANDTDADGDVPTVSAVSDDVLNDDGDIVGSVVLDADGNIIFTPNAKLNAMQEGDQMQVSFSYTINDGRGGSDTASVSFIVSGDADAPTGLALSNLLVDENSDGAVIGNISSSDADAGDVHTYTVDDARFEVVEDNNGNAQLKLKNGQSLDHESFDTVSVEVTATDTTGLSSSKTFAINIQDINDAPVAVDDVVTRVAYEDAELIGHYRFEGGLTIDSKGDYDGVLVNGVTQSETGVIGGSANYSHSDSAGQIKISDLPITDAEDVTVSFWMNWDGIGNVMPIGFERYDLYISGEKMGFNTAGGDQYGVKGVNDLANGWHHITATFHKGDVTKSKLFVDGEVQELSVLNPRFPNNSNAHFDAGELHLGGWGVSESYRFGGQLDEVHVFNGALTSDEVQSIYTSESDGFTNNMLFEDATHIISADTLLANDADADGDTLTLTAVSEDALNEDGDIVGTLILNDDGDIIFVPNEVLNTLQEGDQSRVNFNYTVSDGQGGSDTANVSFTVAGDADAPTGLAISNTSINENTDGVVIGEITSQDADAGDVHTYTVDDARFEIIKDENNKVYLKLRDGQSLNHEAADTVSVEVTVTDSANISVKKLFDINVGNVYEDPVAIDDNIDVGGGAELLGHYRFEEDFLRNSVGGRDAELINGVSRGDEGITGDSAHFEEGRDQGQIKINELPITDADDVTVSFWMNWDGTGNVMPVGFEGYDLHLYGGNIGFNTSAGDLYGVADINSLANSWHHITATFHKGDVTQSTLYIDGEAQVLSSLRSGTPKNSNAHFDEGELYLGGIGKSELYRFSGQLDEVQVFNGVLTDYEVQKIYTTESAGEPTRPYVGDESFTIEVESLLANDELDKGQGAITKVSGDVLNEDGEVVGNVALNEDGDIVFTPNAALNVLQEGDQSQLSFAYTLSNERGVSDTARVSFTVTGKADAPTGIEVSNLSISENSGGAVIGALTSTDIDAGDVHTYTVDDARFEVVVDNNGDAVLKLKSGQSLDYESESEVGITVTTTDSSGLVYSKDFTININDANEFDVSAVSDTDTGSNAVAENVAAGTAVGITAFASDADDTTNDVTYSLSSNPNNAFAIDASTGKVTVSDPSKLDFETAQTMQIEVTATGEDSSISSQSYTIAINDVNEFDVSAVSDTDNTSNAVAENVAAGTAVGITAFASDADGTTNDVTYSLSSNPNNAFAIDANTGKVTVNDPSELDFETAQTMQIEVTATGEDSSISSQSYTIAINDVNEFDVSAVSDTDNTSNAVAENVAAGTAVGITAFSSDADGSTNDVTYSLSSNPDNAFAIDANTGKVTVNDPSKLDFETAQTMQIEVTATGEDGSTSSQSYTIAINDADEFDVSAVSDTDTGSNAVAENVAAGTAVGITAFASDADGTTNDVTYSLSSNPNNAFAIDASTGKVTVSDPSKLDFETAQTMQIEVTATGEDSSTSSQSYTIAINDVNESPEIVSNGGDDNATISVDEGTTNVTTVQTNDADASAAISYSIIGGADAGLFSIDANTGALAFNNVQDYENAQDQGGNNNYEVIVQSSDGSLTDSQTLNVTVNDVNEAPSDFTVEKQSGWSDDGRVNTHSDGHQRMARTAATDDGGYAVTWVSKHQSGDNDDVYVQKFDAQGNQVGNETKVNTDTDSWQMYPDITAVDDGGYVVAWIDGAEGGAKYNMGVHAQRFNADGTKAGEEMDLNTTTNGNQMLSGMTSTDDGGFVAVWLSTGNNRETIAQKFDSSGNKIGGEVQVSSTEEGRYSTDGKVDALADGGYIVTWTSRSNSDISDQQIKFQRFDADGVKVGAETQMSAFTDGMQYTTAVTILEDGGFVVAYHLNDHIDGGGSGAYFQQYDGNGHALGDVVTVVEYADNARAGRNKVAALPDGGYIVVWSDDSADDIDVYMNRYSSDGKLIEDKVVVNNDEGNQGVLDVSVLENGDIVFIWDEYTAADGIDIYQTIYKIDYGDGLVVSKSDTNGVVVGSVVDVVDPDVADTFTYTLSDDAGGAFAIDANSGEITIADNSQFDHTIAHTVDITVQVTDSGGLSYEKTVSIVIDGDAPDIANLHFIGDEDLVPEPGEGENADTIPSGVVIASVESVDTNSNETLSYSLTDNANGKFQIDSVSGEISLVAKHDMASSYQDAVTVQVTGSLGGSYSEKVSILLGRSDDDVLVANDNDNIIYGFDGEDVLVGGAGDDVIYAGTYNATKNVAITNASFEEETLDDGKFDSNHTGWTGVNGYNEVGSWNPKASKFDSESHIDGENVLYVQEDNKVEQILSDTFDANKDYQLTVNVGNPHVSFSDDGYVVHIYSGDTLIGSATGDEPKSGAWEEVVINVDGENFSAADGGALRIELGNTGEYSGSTSYITFDDVRLVEITGDGSTNTIVGGGGNDTLYGGSGRDVIDGEKGDDVIYASDGKDSVAGGDGNDEIHGGAGDDSLGGEEGDDVIYGGAGDDNMAGGKGDDVIIGGEGDDLMSGEDGNDIFVFDNGHGDDSLSGGSGAAWVDAIDLSQYVDDAVDPSSPWQIEVGGSVVDYDIESGLLELGQDVAGVIQLDDGSKISFAQIENIEW